MIAFHVPAVPVAQPRPRSRVFVDKGGNPRTQNYTPTRHPVNVFKAAAQQAFATEYDGPPLEGPLAVTLVFVLPRPGGKVWKMKPMLRYWHAKRPDIDNLSKAIMDALSDLAWRDDAQVCDISASKVVAAGDEQPHVEVGIERLTAEPAQPEKED
jgi:Holliday junction resolvase RusA-like endonuclease